MVSVVIPVSNGEGTLGAQLEALAGQTYRGAWEVIVADNGSTDRSREVARSFSDILPGLLVVDASHHPGASHARNVGTSYARGDFILFCDDDDVVSAGWVEAMAEAGRSYDVVGGSLEMHLLNEYRRSSSWNSPRDRLPVVLQFLPFASGSNCGVQASVLQSLGGFDAGWTGSGQDVDLCWRAQLASYRLGYAPDAVVHSRIRTGVRAMWRQAYQRGRGQTRLYGTYRTRGARRPRVLSGARAWAVLLVSAGDLLQKSKRPRWTYRAGIRCGRLVGSVANHVAMF
jgi:glycosyltransferase involved in cell wall biosynthesis